MQRKSLSYWPLDLSCQVYHLLVGLKRRARWKSPLLWKKMVEPLKVVTGLCGRPCKRFHGRGQACTANVTNAAAVIEHPRTKKMWYNRALKWAELKYDSLAQSMNRWAASGSEMAKSAYSKAQNRLNTTYDEAREYLQNKF